MSSKDNLALDLEHGVRRWDRARWISVFSSHNPTIREVTECLGLGLSASSSTTNRGIPKFDNPDYRKLSSEVTKLSKELPKERDALLDFAADASSLDVELDELLATYGPAIWGKLADRSCLLTPDPSKKTYNKHLIFDHADHKEILKIHLHRWIIIKACYYIRNMKLKRPSGANEYDTLADMDGESGSRLGTPQSFSPPERVASAGAELEVKPINFKKRKSSARISLSDGEEHVSSPTKRHYSTMPSGRNDSPRRGLKSLYPAGPASVENIPPVLSQNRHASPPVGSVSESGRVHLSPLASNDLNGTPRPPAGVPQTSVPAGYPALNPGTFTAVNTPPLPRDANRDTSHASSREAHLPSPAQNHREANYTSPYEPTSRNAVIAPNAPDSRFAQPPPASVAPTQGFHAGGSPVAKSPSGLSHREFTIAQHPHHMQIAPQHQPPVSQHVSSHVQHPVQPPVQPSGPPHAPPPPHTLPQPHIPTQQQLPHRPPSRANTPSIPNYNRTLAPLGISRSSTPLAQAASLPYLAVPTAQVTPSPLAPIAPIAPASGIPATPAYATPFVPISQAQVAVPPSHHGPTQHSLQHQPLLKSQVPEVAQIVPPPQAPPRSSDASTDLRLLQCEVTAGLVTFFYPRSSAPPDEPSLLQRLHTLWYYGASIFERDLGPNFDLISKILTAWLHERQAITALRHSLASQPGVSPTSLVDRLLAMNDLRVMRLKWKNMSTVDGLSPEDLLCTAFRVMTNTEGSELLFRDGLERLNGGVFEFLRNEDAKIIMHRR